MDFLNEGEILKRKKDFGGAACFLFALMRQ